MVDANLAASVGRTIELPSYEAAPLQVMRPRDLSPFIFHLSLPLSRATIHPLPANRCYQATPGNGATILPGRYRHREMRSAIILPTLRLCPDNRQCTQPKGRNNLAPSHSASRRYVNARVIRP